MKSPILQNIKTKYPFITQIFLFLLIFTTSVIFLKISGVKNWGNNFAAVYSSNPNSGAYSTDGSIYAMVPDTSGGVYIGGDFTFIGLYTGSGVPVIASTGVPVSTFPKVLGTVLSVVQDGTGGWYIGGAFTQVGGITRNSLAHIFSNGTLDTNFNPTQNSTVNTLALSADGDTLYVGGQFTTINASTTHDYVAALNTSDGTLVGGFNPDVNSSVQTIALSPDGNTLYIGGNFTTVNGATTRNKIAAVSATSGVATAFNPNANSGVTIITISSDGSTVYMGGGFTLVNGGTIRNFIASVNATSGVATGFDPDVDSTVESLTLSADGDILYIGGNFITINAGATLRNRIAAVSTSTGAVVTGFNPDANGAVASLALSTDGNTLYMGGAFTMIGITTRTNIAAVDATSGSLVSGFNPNVDNNVVAAIALSQDGNTLYMGGNFTSVNVTSRNNIGHILSNGTLDLNFDPDVNSIVYALTLSSDGGTLYIGGSFSTINGGTTRNRIAAVNATGAVVTAFNPNSANDVYALTLSLDGNTLYMGGAFTAINGGTSRNRIAAVSTSTGTATSFNPNANNQVYTLALSPDGNTLYMGGVFTAVNGGTTRNRVAAVNTSTGTSTTFNPNVGSSVNALILSSNGSTLYIGGNFNTINGGTTRNYIAAVNTSTGTTTTFNPNAGFQVYSLDLSPDESTLFIGGNFGTINGGTTRINIAAVNTTDGLVTTFDPNADGPVNALTFSSNGNILYIGGDFFQIGGIDNPYFAAFLVIPSPSYGGSSSYVSSTPIPLPAPLFFQPTVSTTTLPIVTTIPNVATTTSLVATTTKALPPITLKPATTKPTIKPATSKPGTTQSTGITVPTTSTATTSDLPVTQTPIETVVKDDQSVIPNSLLLNIQESIAKTYLQAIEVLTQASQTIGDIINSPAGGIITKVIATVGIVLGTIAAIAGIAFATPISFSEVGLIPTRMLGLLAGALGIRKKQRPWGTVYDSVTKRPLDPAYVTLIDTTTNKEIGTAITDLDGRYSFSALPGVYKLVAAKTNYSFPSNKISKATFDEVYNDLYFGSEITITTIGEIITKNIPMDPQGFDWNEFTKNKSNINTFVKGTDVTWAKISKKVFVFGFIVSLIALFFAPRPYNIVITSLYATAYILNYFVFKVKKSGTLRDKITGLPLSFAIVKIYREGMLETPILKKIADKEGKYHALLPKGNYVIQIDKKNDDGSYTQVYKSDLINFNTGVVNQDVEV